MGTRILIVDDDASFLGLVAELLAERGFDILGQAMDAGEALAAALRECPDGILLDINLSPDGAQSVIDSGAVHIVISATTGQAGAGTVPASAYGFSLGRSGAGWELLVGTGACGGPL